MHVDALIYVIQYAQFVALLLSKVLAHCNPTILKTYLPTWIHFSNKIHEVLTHF